MKRWQLWVGLVISGVFIYLALSGLNLPTVWQAMKSASYAWLIPGILVYFVGVWVRAWRWHYLLSPIKKIPSNKMFPIVTIGFMGNNIFPARAGEILRSVILKQREDVPISASLATIVVERVFDGLVMLAFVFLNLGQLARMTTSSGFVGNIQLLAFWGAIAFIGVLFFFLVAASFPRFTEKLVLSILKLVLPEKVRIKIEGIILRFLSGLGSLRSPKDTLMIFFTSVIVWLLETVKYWFIMKSFDFEVSFFALMLMNGVVNLATIIPSAPGYIGTFDALGIAVLVAYGVSGEIAAGYTLVLHAALWLPVTVLGAYYYLRQPLRWGKDLQRATDSAEN